MGKEQSKKIKEYMKEIIYHLDRILQNYNISFNELNKYSRNRLQLETSDPATLQRFIRQKFHKNIGINDARELEILFLTYNYISSN